MVTGNVIANDYATVSGYVVENITFNNHSSCLEGLDTTFCNNAYGTKTVNSDGICP